MNEVDCPFCHLDRDMILVEGERAVLIQDACPVSPGHCLIVPRRHLCSIFDSTETESIELWNTVRIGKDMILSDHSPAGFNVGFNDGAVAGQTIAHAHIHLIPRYVDDVVDPRGGLRWILPNEATYSDCDRS